MPQRLHDHDYGALIRHLVEAREQASITQTELASRLGRPQSFVSKYERLERRLDLGEWRLIAIALDLDPVTAFAEIHSKLTGRG